MLRIQAVYHVSRHSSDQTSSRFTSAVNPSHLILILRVLKDILYLRCVDVPILVQGLCWKLMVGQLVSKFPGLRNLGLS